MKKSLNDSLSSPASKEWNLKNKWTCAKRPPKWFYNTKIHLAVIKMEKQLNIVRKVLPFVKLLCPYKINFTVARWPTGRFYKISILLLCSHLIILLNRLDVFFLSWTKIGFRNLTFRNIVKKIDFICFRICSRIFLILKHYYGCYW